MNQILVLFLIAVVQAGFWIDVPFVSQSEDGCGIASAWMVLKYWEEHLPAESQPVDHAELVEEFSAVNGIDGSKLSSILSTRGLQSFTFNGTLPDLENHVRKGRPVIVCIDGGSRKVPLHYVVVVGFAPDQHVVLLNDPARRKLLKIDRDSFEASWRESNFWSLLAVPKN